MKLTQSWLDRFDTVWASYEGLAGGYTWMLVSPLEKHDEVLKQIDKLPEGFKGTLFTLFLAENSPTALLPALEEYQPKGVLVVADSDLGSGDAITLKEVSFETSQGTTYSEGGTLPAWQSAVSGISNTSAENALANACASVGIPVVVSSANKLAQNYKTWWKAVPQALRFEAPVKA